MAFQCPYHDAWEGCVNCPPNGSVTQFYEELWSCGSEDPSIFTQALNVPEEISLTQEVASLLSTHNSGYLGFFLNILKFILFWMEIEFSMYWKQINYTTPVSRISWHENFKYRVYSNHSVLLYSIWIFKLYIEHIKEDYLAVFIFYVRTLCSSTTMTCLSLASPLTTPLLQYTSFCTWK